MKRPLSLLLALLLLGCAPAYSAARNLAPAQAVAQSAPVCPTAPVVLCIAVTATPQGIPTQLVTATPRATALATVTSTPTQEPTPTQIVGLPTETPAADPTRGTYSPFFGQRVREGPDTKWAQVGWLGGGSVWQVIDVTYYPNGDYWAHIRDSARGIDGWCAVVYTGLAYGVFTPD